MSDFDKANREAFTMERIESQLLAEPVCSACGHPVARHDYAAAWRAFVCGVPECVCDGYDPERS